MDNKKFIKQLDLEQLKTLIVLGLAECEREHEYDCSYLYHLHSLNDIKLKGKEWEDVISVRAVYAKNDCSIASFSINDFSMKIHDGSLSMELDNVLYMYLANQFGDVYIDYLYEKRLKDAEKERDLLLKNSSNYIEEFGPRMVLKK